MSDKNLGICFQWIEPCANARLRRAQEEAKQSIIELGLEPVLFPAGPEMVKFRDILQFAREHCTGSSFVWCNSDVVLRRNPYEVDDGERVHGFHRTEIPSGQICPGVDMYLVPCRLWDEWIRDDAPDMWCGATHIDWWLTNACALRFCYRAHNGYIDHVSHQNTGASKGRQNEHYRHNVRHYNRWARRAGASVFLERINLPWVGESQSPFSDLLQKFSVRT
jgi:hypothetical protein